MAPTGSSHANFALAALTAVGGTIGYLKAKSVPSLLAGLGFGAVFAYTGHMINSGDGKTGHTASVCASLVLTGLMGARFAKSNKLMPAGILTAAGAVSSVYHINKAREWY